MKLKRNWYAKYNAYATQTSIGFANTWGVKQFATKEERDRFVLNSNKLGTQAITARQAKKLMPIETYP